MAVLTSGVMPMATRLQTKTPFKPGLLPVTMIVAIVAWALYAVLMLTGTVTAANQIHERVVAINTVYPTINENLKAVALAADTGRIAGNIREAAAPLSPQFTQIQQSVTGIDGSVTSILGSVNTIHDSVLSINDRVHAIHGSVVPIAAGLSSVNGRAGSINGSVHHIGDHFTRIRDHADSIDDRLVHGAKGRIQTVIESAKGILKDTDKLEKTLVPDILKNAHAIEQSPLIDPADTSRLDPKRFNPLLAGISDPTHLPSLLGLAQAAHKPSLPTPGALALPFAGQADKPGSPRHPGLLPSPQPGHLGPVPQLTGGLFGSG